MLRHAAPLRLAVTPCPALFARSISASLVSPYGPMTTWHSSSMGVPPSNSTFSPLKLS